MPCSIYKGAQRRLCYATKEWTDWSKVKNIDLKIQKTKSFGGKIKDGKK